MKCKEKREPTKSEKETFFGSSRVFTSSFSFLSPKYDKGKGGKELCDCLLLFQNTSIVFQIKEKTTSKMNDKDWFESDVCIIAKNQIETSVRILIEADKHHFYIDKGNNTIVVDKNNEIVPIIVFMNEDYKDYPRVIYSEGLGFLISVFEMKDFIDAFNNLLVPNEIIKYLNFRNSLFKEGNHLLNSRFIHFEHQEYSLLIGGGIKDEADLADIYYQYYYAKLGVKKEQIIEYNHIINYLDEVLPQDHPAKPRLINLFLSVDIALAIKVSKHWRVALERASSNDAYPPFSLQLDDLEVILVSKPISFSNKQFSNYYTNLEMLYSYKDRIKDIIAITFIEDAEKQIVISVFGWHNEFVYPDEHLEKMLSIYRNNYIENKPS